MSLEKINIRNGLLILMIVAASACRFINLGQLSILSNFTPVGAVALFGGAYFSDRFKAYFVPLFTLFISDQVINYAYYGKIVLFYDGAFWVYISFVIMVFLGSMIKKTNISSVLLASLASVLVHWLLTDIQPWWYGTVFPKTALGYIDSLIAAIPFERNLMLGNLVYGAILFGGFEWAKKQYPVLQIRKTMAL